MVLLLIVKLSFAHVYGNISGHVIDARDGSPMFGVNVQIKSTLTGTATDIYGNFEMKNIQVGTYLLEFSFIGYQSQSIHVMVKENGTDSLQVIMKESSIGLNEVTIQGSRPVSAASSKEIRAIDMQLKPLRSSQDMLLMVPGLYIAQHQGGGKAEQVFLRGFDCDHGTDISIHVDGAPVNMVSHAHGQGYADLHFLISETVNEMDVNKGPYLASFGDFYTAGAVSFHTKDILDNNLIKIEAGQFNTQKYTLLYQPSNGGSQQNIYFAAQYHHTDGPFDDPENFERMNVFAKYFLQFTPTNKLTISTSAFTTGWDASGQIPERAIKNQLIGRFGALDRLEGGTTNRKDVKLNYKFLSPKGEEFEANTYFIRYGFKLYSDFTYFLNDPKLGDMLEQYEERSTQGANARYRFKTELLGRSQIHSLGGGYRGDNIDVELWHSPERERLEAMTKDDINEQNLNIWYQGEYTLAPELRMVLGLRHDFFTFSKTDKLGSGLSQTSSKLPHTSGGCYQSIFSPKINFIYSPSRKLDLFLNLGQGFHSNDARSVVLGSKIAQLSKLWLSQGESPAAVENRLVQYGFDPVMQNTIALPRALAGELGFRTKLFNKLHLNGSAWYLQLEKEFVYSGDGGTTELSHPTQRLGFDLGFRFPILGNIWADFDMTASKGTIKELPSGENYIPLAPHLVMSGGISTKREKGLSASLRFRHLGDRPANEDNSVVALGHTLYNLSISYSYKQFIFAAELENILNTEWNEAQFSTETRLKDESTGTTDLCLTPGNPRNIQLSLTYRF